MKMVCMYCKKESEEKICYRCVIHFLCEDMPMFCSKPEDYEEHEKYAKMLDEIKNNLVVR